MKKIAAFAATLFLAATAQAGCYTVLNAKGEIISQTSTPPVDMRYQLHQTVPYKYGEGARLVFGSADPSCGEPADLYDDSWRLKQAQAKAAKGKKRATKKRRTTRRARTAAAAPAAQAAPAAAPAQAAPAPAAPAASQ